jgi:hypothetical protein
MHRTPSEGPQSARRAPAERPQSARRAPAERPRSTHRAPAIRRPGAALCVVTQPCPKGPSSKPGNVALQSARCCFGQHYLVQTARAGKFCYAIRQPRAARCVVTQPSPNVPGTAAPQSALGVPSERRKAYVWLTMSAAINAPAPAEQSAVRAPAERPRCARRAYVWLIMSAAINAHAPAEQSAGRAPAERPQSALGAPAEPMYG